MILQFHGLQMSDFPDQTKALAAADEIIAGNKEEYDHPGTVREHANPLLQKYWYVKSGGKSRKISVGTKERLGMSADDTKTIEKHLGIGDNQPADDGEKVVVKIENPSWEPFFTALKKAKTALGVGKTQIGKSQSLSVQFQVAGRNDPRMLAHHTEMAKMLNTFQDFLQSFEVKVAEVSLYTAATDKDVLDEAISEMSQICALGMAHADGHKDVVKRYKGILEGKVFMDPASAVRSLSRPYVEECGAK